eukprot:gene13744-biopygen11268
MAPNQKLGAELAPNNLAAVGRHPRRRVAPRPARRRRRRRERHWDLFVLVQVQGEHHDARRAPACRGEASDEHDPFMKTVLHGARFATRHANPGVCHW